MFLKRVYYVYAADGLFVGIKGFDRAVPFTYGEKKWKLKKHSMCCIYIYEKKKPENIINILYAYVCNVTRPSSEYN